MSDHHRPAVHHPTADVSRASDSTAADPAANSARRFRSLPARVVFMLVTATVLIGPQIIGQFSARTASLSVALAESAVAVAAALALYTGAVRMGERRPVVELRLRGAPAGLLRGAVVGLSLFTVSVGVIAVLSDQTLVRTRGTAADLLYAAGVMTVPAVSEELIFRGVVFRILEELTGTWVALATSAGLFGSVHLFNPHATWWSAAAIAVEAGVLFGAAYAATRRLWVPIGLHFAWNVTESGIFGTPDSGTTLPHPGLLETTMTGPTAVTGGSFGPEASVVVLVLCAGVGALFLRQAVRTGQIRSPRWAH